MDLFRKTMKPVEQVLKDAGVKKDEIDDVSYVVHTPPLHLTRDRLSLSVVQLESPKSNNSSKNTSTARNLPRVSTLTKLSPTERLFRVAFFPVMRVVAVSSLSMCAH
jgi:hypothetical protein